MKLNLISGMFCLLLTLMTLLALALFVLLLSTPTALLRQAPVQPELLLGTELQVAHYPPHQAP